MESKKPFYRSKVCLLNGAVAALGVFMSWDSPQHIATALACINILLRFFTSKAVTITGD
jgi:hypothetical protein